MKVVLQEHSCITMIDIIIFGLTTVTSKAKLEYNNI